MKSKEIRQAFLDFFESKEHKIVPSSPIVNKDDPTLMFTNAGMNQFKDFFLGNRIPDFRRATDTQKCLRASGKHNDLEDVGVDSYHHTMFEMLGNWSFGDYFKKEAIDWAWELLTEVYKLPKDRLYVSVFEGDKGSGLDADEEAVSYWSAHVPKERILYFDKTDNFWEMGDTGPCGPCSEIHVDIRPDAAREKVDGATLVNMDDPLVIEIWNLVFIQYNRKADRSLEDLPEKHVDTGMGFERLCMAMQGKTSNYDTDIFAPFIQFLEKESGIEYTFSYDPAAKTDMAMRVVVDHLRAVSFAIADGLTPSNNGAGYVIRRILRRAVRYYYSFLNINEPLLYKLLPLFAENFQEIFPEVKEQLNHITRLILSEEKQFLKTLSLGLKRFDKLNIENNIVSGKDAFTLFDTYGFPIDLTRLIASEKGFGVDEEGYEKEREIAKKLSQKDAEKSVGDWHNLIDSDGVEFIGYETLYSDDSQLVKYRTIEVKKKKQFQIVLDKTPFYGESGGQIGDKGLLWFDDEKIAVINTQKENDLIIHYVNKLPQNKKAIVRAEVQKNRRAAISKNHTAAHLLHSALHKVIGEHALQRGQEVRDDKFRFDFSHHEKLEKKDLLAIENMVNAKIRENIQLDDKTVSIEEATSSGATMLFGEKYGEEVRVVTFDKDYSSELCGGTHVQSTGEIGYFKILSEGSVAAGVRRIEGITAEAAEKYLNKELDILDETRDLFKNPKDLVGTVQKLQDENKALQKEIEKLLAAQASALKGDLKVKFEIINGVNVLAERLPLANADAIKTLGYELEKEIGNALIVFAAEIKGKPQLMVIVSKNLVDEKRFHAGNMVRELAKEIKGGGGGQPFFAAAGGKDASGIENALAKVKEMV
ncbi:MAG: alanyl-tRNA synthetase [Maribacter sp.]|jgi:alanyl-tRNA synthetase